jgi:transposase
MLWDQVVELQATVKRLELKVAELERNSRSSSKPPSSDKGNFTNPPKPKSLRGKSGKKPGGQEGHCGETLRQSEVPDRVIDHRIDEDTQCSTCGEVFGECAAGSDPLARDACENRQVFDLPPIRLEVTEHRAEKRCCSGCGTVTTASFPEGVSAPVQYGPQVQAIALYLGGYQLLPYQRLTETFSELFNCPLSAGTLANFVKRGGEKAEQAMEPIREALVNSEVAHADETGCTVNGKRHWLHVFSTRLLTCFHVDAKRGAKAMQRMGLIERFRGSLTHDCLGAYFAFTLCRHFLCNAHLQRELIYLNEQMDQPWAGKMITLLLEAKQLRESANSPPGTGGGVLDEDVLQPIRNRYSDIVLEGFKINPEPPPPPPGKRGKIKRSKALNLLIRLEDRYEEIMGYFEYGHVPYDNNQAERDLRMMKVREKISGTFRSDRHSKAFCDLRSVISSARKQSLPMLETLTALLRSPTQLGERLADAERT